jgi:hypothetical protein
METIQKYEMDIYTAVGIAEGFEEPESEEQVIAAWQYLVDTGVAWQLQGRFGRTAHDLIQNGIINPPSRGYN